MLCRSFASVCCSRRSFFDADLISIGRISLSQLNYCYCTLSWLLQLELLAHFTEARKAKADVGRMNRVGGNFHRLLFCSAIATIPTHNKLKTMAATLAETKCPCCDNPWGRATGDFFAKLCVECEEKEPEDKGLSRSNMDFEVSPSENFYNYSNGGWIKENPIPPGYPSWNTFLTLHVKSQENLKDLLAELAEKNKDELSTDEAKVSAFYAAALDEEAIETAGLEPMTLLLNLCNEISEESTKDKAAYAKLLGEMSAKYGVSPFFCIGASPDNKNSNHSLCQVSQGGLGLPDRDYYFDEDKEEKRVAYKKHVAMMLTLLDDPAATEPTEAAVAAANQVYALELELAEAHMTKTECRDPEATYNKMAVADLTKNGDDAFDFASYFVGATGKSAENLGDINVRNTEALKRVAKVASTIEPEILKNYLRWASVKSCAPYLAKVFVDENFDFYEKTLSGTDEIKPRWKRAMTFTESALGEALGQLYCAKYFDEECKGRALKIVEDVRAALEERLKEVEWMGEATREEALKKMAGFKVKIGYPDKWIDYTTMDIKDDDTFLDMLFKARAFEHAREVKEMNAPTDRDKWFLTPQTVNAYYHPSLNEIVFPAAILQPPFFNREADDGTL